MHRRRRDTSHTEGSAAERLFQRAASARGWRWKRATPAQDEREHWDLRVCGRRVDVKARKRMRRADADFVGDLLWVELKNVAGKRGWVEGRADVVAFQSTCKDVAASTAAAVVDDVDDVDADAQDCFVMVLRSELLRYTRQRVWRGSGYDGGPTTAASFVRRPTDATDGRVYRRRGRLDVVTAVPLCDVLALDGTWVLPVIKKA